MTDATASDRPALRIVHGGEPSADELGALVVALQAGTAPAPVGERQRRGWADRAAMLSRPLDHGPGRWVASARPS